MVTALGLAVLIVVFIQASGAHFNPVVTAADWILGHHTPRRYSLGLAPAYAGIAPASVPAFIAAQLVGGAIGTLLAVTLYPVRRDRVQVEEPAQLAG